MQELFLPIAMLALCALLAAATAVGRARWWASGWVAVALCAAALAAGNALQPLPQTQALLTTTKTLLGLVGLVVGLGFGVELRRKPRALVRCTCETFFGVSLVMVGVLMLMGWAIQARGHLDLMALAPCAAFIAAALLALPSFGRRCGPQTLSVAPAAALFILLALMWLHSPDNTMGRNGALAAFFGAICALPLCLLPTRRARVQGAVLFVGLLLSTLAALILNLSVLSFSFGMGLTLGLASSARRQLLWKIERVLPALLIVPLVLWAALWTHPTSQAMVWGAAMTVGVVCTRRILGLATPPPPEAGQVVALLALMAALLTQSLETWPGPGVGAQILSSLTSIKPASQAAPLFVVDLHNAFFIAALFLVASIKSGPNTRESTS